MRYIHSSQHGDNMPTVDTRGYTVAIVTYASLVSSQDAADRPTWFCRLAAVPQTSCSRLVAVPQTSCSRLVAVPQPFRSRLVTVLPSARGHPAVVPQRRPSCGSRPSLTEVGNLFYGSHTIFWLILLPKARKASIGPIRKKIIGESCDFKF